MSTGLTALPALSPCSVVVNSGHNHTPWEEHEQHLGMPRPGCCSLCCSSARFFFSALVCRCDKVPPGRDGLCARSRVLFAFAVQAEQALAQPCSLSTHPSALSSETTPTWKITPCCVFPFCASRQLPARNIASLHGNVSINVTVISQCSRSLYLVLICTTACICALQKDASRIHFLSHIT